MIRANRKLEWFGRIGLTRYLFLSVSALFRPVISLTTLSDLSLSLSLSLSLPLSLCLYFSLSGFAIRPAIYRAPKPGFPKTAAETAAETAGETRGAGGSAGGTAAETAGKSAVSLLLRARAVPPAFSAVPPARSSLRSSFGESGLGGL